MQRKKFFEDYINKNEIFSDAEHASDHHENNEFEKAINETGTIQVFELGITNEEISDSFTMLHSEGWTFVTMIPDVSAPGTTLSTHRAVFTK